MLGNIGLTRAVTTSLLILRPSSSAFVSNSILTKAFVSWSTRGERVRLFSESEEQSFDQEAAGEAYPPGVADGFFITRQYSTPYRFDLAEFGDISDRLQLTPENITLPVSLMLLDPLEYPSFSKARKAIRKGNVVIHRAIDRLDQSHLDKGGLELDQLSRGRVGDRVYAGDIVCKQERLSHGAYSSLLSYDSKPAFDLPVIYEDDYLAVVNKPAGVLVYGEGNKGRNTVKFALPYVVAPPAHDIVDRLERPELCHRLDKPTSGLLIVGKTKPAVVSLSRQFEDREVQKTYTAILNGKLDQPESSTLSSVQAFEMGVDVDPTSTDRWHIAQNVMDEKNATTIWRVLRYQRSLKAENQTLTIVEMKPKSGRYHQLRRQMAWIYNCPIIGDTTYGGTLEHKRWGRGLMLCSNRVVFTHPCYSQSDLDQKDPSTMLTKKHDGSGVLVTLSIDLAPKFESFLAAEEKKFLYSNETATIPSS
jgi:23S rRNA-/tRNA-specific pseudouridylate synthase